MLERSWNDETCRYWEQRLFKLVGHIRGRQRQAAYKKLSAELGISGDDLRHVLNKYRGRCQWAGIDPLTGIGPKRRFLGAKNKRVVNCKYCSKPFIAYDSRRYCNPECRKKATKELHDNCKRLLRLKWKHKAIQKVLPLGSATISRLARQIGRGAAVARLVWDDEMCRAVQAEYCEMQRALGQHRDKLQEKLAAKYGVSLSALAGRLSRFRKRCAEKGISPFTEEESERPAVRLYHRKKPSIWTDEQCEQALKIVNRFKKEECYSRAAKILGIKRGALIGRLWRYKNGKRVTSQTEEGRAESRSNY